MMAYLINTTPDDNATMLVTCPAFPEVTTFGAKDDPKDVFHSALAAIEEAIAARIVDGDPLPRPATAAECKGRLYIKLPLLTELKAELYRQAAAQGVTRAELARRLGWHREQVDRLFRLDHASRLNQLEAAFKAMNQDLDVRVRVRVRDVA
jgi:antitoxin HicB